VHSCRLFIVSSCPFDANMTHSDFQINSISITYNNSLIGFIHFIQTGGYFVCKLFDTFLPFTVHLIALLWLMFEEVTIVKPFQSRPANSERFQSLPPSYTYTHTPLSTHHHVCPCTASSLNPIQWTLQICRLQKETRPPGIGEENCIHTVQSKCGNQSIEASVEARRDGRERLGTY
jgi:hypothetical protein